MLRRETRRGSLSLGLVLSFTFDSQNGTFAKKAAASVRRNEDFARIEDCRILVEVFANSCYKGLLFLFRRTRLPTMCPESRIALDTRAITL